MLWCKLKVVLTPPKKSKERIPKSLFNKIQDILADLKQTGGPSNFDKKGIDPWVAGMDITSRRRFFPQRLNPVSPSALALMTAPQLSLQTLTQAGHHAENAVVRAIIKPTPSSGRPMALRTMVIHRHGSQRAAIFRLIILGNCLNSVSYDSSQGILVSLLFFSPQNATDLKKILQGRKLSSANLKNNFPLQNSQKTRRRRHGRSLPR